MRVLRIPKESVIEEAALPGSRERRYYPARIGEVLDGRYRIIGKLGYAYYVVKICTEQASERIESGKNTEIQLLQRLNSLTTNHPGASGVRRLEDSFTIAAKGGSKHTCLVHQPLGMSLHDLQGYTGGSIPLDILKNTMLHVLLSLDYLHTEASIVHTDLQPSNILMGLQDDSVLRDYEVAENTFPTAPVDDGERAVYRSRGLPVPRSTLGLPILADLGEARDSSVSKRDEIMPDAYRAPEIILDECWDVKVDVWNLGVLVWSLLEGENLFSGLDPEGELNNYYHLAEMVALLGPAPAHFVMLGELGPKYFNRDGSWKGAVGIPNISLEKKVRRLEGQEKAMFLAFIRRMLQWDPVSRPTAKELIYDDFLGIGHRQPEG